MPIALSVQSGDADRARASARPSSGRDRPVVGPACRDGVGAPLAAWTLCVGEAGRRGDGAP